MSSPFEELEYLADYLPEEGESVVVTRRNGELVCQAISTASEKEGVADTELYGRLVLANERLDRLNVVPLWSCALGAFVTAVAFFQFTHIGWPGWYVAVGIAAVAGLACSSWIAVRRERLFRREIVPMLDRQMRHGGFTQYALVGAIRQHPELSALLTELSRGVGE